MSLETNLQFAREALAYTRSRITIGSSNNDLDIVRTGFNSVACVGEMRFDIRANSRNPNGISEIARYAERYRCGNCGEKAAVAFMFLYRRNVFPIEYVYLTNGDHTFITIGKETGANNRQPSTWGRNAVICDPWYNTGLSGFAN